RARRATFSPIRSRGRSRRRDPGTTKAALAGGPWYGREKAGGSGLLADLVAEELDDRGLGADDVLDLLGGVQDVGLLEEGDLLVELAHAALDHLLGDLLRLAGLHGLIDAEAAFAVDDVRGDVVGGDALGRRDRGDHVHADLLEGLVVDVALGDD